MINRTLFVFPTCLVHRVFTYLHVHIYPHTCAQHHDAHCDVPLDTIHQCQWCQQCITSVSQYCWVDLLVSWDLQSLHAVCCTVYSATFSGYQLSPGSKKTASNEPVQVSWKRMMSQLEVKLYTYQFTLQIDIMLMTGRECKNDYVVVARISKAIFRCMKRHWDYDITSKVHLMQVSLSESHLHITWPTLATNANHTSVVHLISLTSTC